MTVFSGKSLRPAIFAAVVCLGFVFAPEGYAHRDKGAPLSARQIRNPLKSTPENLARGQELYLRLCAACHGADGTAKTEKARTLAEPPLDFTDTLIDYLSDGEIFWDASNGVAPVMPPAAKDVSETERFQIVLWIRELKRKAVDATFGLPPGFPRPKTPEDNPVTPAKVELGRHLFYDKRLSGNGTQSCASCHQQRLAFTDGRTLAVGSTGQTHPRQAMSLVNVAYSPVLTWANPNLRRLESQALVPLFGEHPVEMGLPTSEPRLVAQLSADPVYVRLFRAAFPLDSIDILHITMALASFERTIISGRSPYDRYRFQHQDDAISASAKRGEELFSSERLECFHCHGGFNFTGTVDYAGKSAPEIEFHNTGLYNLAGAISYPPGNTGLYEFTRDTADVGKFKAPTLRNIEVTAPYFHDGSARTLDDVITHYEKGGRRITSGPLAGNGADNPNRSEFIKPFHLSKQERADLIAFLLSLTDKSLLTDERFSDPWPQVAPPANTAANRP